MLLSKNELATIPEDNKYQEQIIRLILLHENLGLSCSLRLHNKWQVNKVMVRRLLEGSHCRFKFAYQIILNER